MIGFGPWPDNGPWGWEVAFAEDEIGKTTNPDPWDAIHKHICGDDEPEEVWQRWVNATSCAVSPTSSDDVRELEALGKCEEAAVAAFLPGLPKEAPVTTVVASPSWLVLRWRELFQEAGCLREVGEVVLAQARSSSSASGCRRTTA
mmetsp:Transcript_40741/g.73604  ORF Transcript_40741/g.73604 Transcript_40741/m.73604 type:complete len:146 (-) Transcript_40741:116-553(-)